jgi:PAS domain-containing protein
MSGKIPAYRRSERAEAQLHVVLDNMPGALAYTDDDLNIVFCNDRFKDMYPVPAELLEPGRPYPNLLRYLAENGYYGAGDVTALVAKRVESLRNPSGKSFEDRSLMVEPIAFCAVVPPRGAP